MPRGGKREGAGRKPDSPEVKEAKRLEKNARRRKSAIQARAAAAADEAATSPKPPPAPKPAQVVRLRVATTRKATKPPPDVADEVREANANMSPLDYALMVMRDPRAEPARRDKMALKALEILHPAPRPTAAPAPRAAGPDGETPSPAAEPPGKRQQQYSAASAVAGGSRLRPFAPPPVPGKT